VTPARSRGVRRNISPSGQLIVRGPNWPEVAEEEAWMSSFFPRGDSDIEMLVSQLGVRERPDSFSSRDSPVQRMRSTFEGPLELALVDSSSGGSEFSGGLLSDYSDTISSPALSSSSGSAMSDIVSRIDAMDVGQVRDPYDMGRINVNRVILDDSYWNKLESAKRDYDAKSQEQMEYKSPWYGWFVPHHGNYMGAYWNNGKFQSSEDVAYLDPVDYGDYESMIHDIRYGRGEDLADADLEYAAHMIGQGEDLWEKAHNTLAGLAVGGQGVLRTVGVMDRGGTNPDPPAKRSVFSDQRDRVHEWSKKNVPINPFKPLEKLAVKFLSNGMS